MSMSVYKIKNKYFSAQTTKSELFKLKNLIQRWSDYTYILYSQVISSVFRYNACVFLPYFLRNNNENETESIYC